MYFTSGSVLDSRAATARETKESSSDRIPPASTTVTGASETVLPAEWNPIPRQIPKPGCMGSRCRANMARTWPRLSYVLYKTV